MSGVLHLVPWASGVRDVAKPKHRPEARHSHGTAQHYCSNGLKTSCGERSSSSFCAGRMCWPFLPRQKPPANEACMAAAMLQCLINSTYFQMRDLWYEQQPSEAAPQVCCAGGYCLTPAISQPRCLKKPAKVFCLLLIGINMQSAAKASPCA